MFYESPVIPARETADYSLLQVGYIPYDTIIASIHLRFTSVIPPLMLQ